MKEGYGTLSYTNGEKYEVQELDLDSGVIVTDHALYSFLTAATFLFNQLPIYLFFYPLIYSPFLVCLSNRLSVCAAIGAMAR
jgi:hypothetical protein